jgi:hypothetical protein
MARRLRAFISFDYDHDSDLKTMLVGQARHADTPFEIADWSVKEHQTEIGRRRCGGASGPSTS